MEKQGWWEELPPAVQQVLGSYLLQTQSELHRLDSAFHEQFADAQWPDCLQLVENYCLKRFDLIANQLLFASVSADPTSLNPLYEQYLELTKEKGLKFLSEALHPLRSDLREDFLSRITLKLGARKLKWLAEAKEAKIEAARKLISQADQLSASEKEDFGNAVADLAKESPRTAGAVEKFKRYSAKVGKAIGEDIRKIVVEAVSETVKKLLSGS